MATSDGVPVAWMLRREGASDQRRVSGSDLMLECGAAAAASEAIFRLGSNRGLECLHRPGSEPGRLWKRYLVTHTLFMVGAVRQLVSWR